MKFYQHLLLIVLFTSTHAFAQQAQLSGLVQTTKGEPMPFVTVTLPAIKKTTITDSLGKFVWQQIPFGKYVLRVQTNPPKDTIIAIQQAAVQINLIADNEVTTLEDVVIVAASKTNSRIEDLPTKVEVLGAEEVTEENQIKPGNIASLLGDIAGIQIQQTNAATNNADMRIQGLQGKYTQILRDGMPLFGGFSGSFGILQIPPLDLQQIELVKGAASTLYGGGAIAGMLNLVSKKPKLGKPEHAITINTSTLKENNLNTFFSGRNKKIGYTFFAGATSQKEIDTNHDGYSDVAAVNNYFIHPRLFFYFNPTSSLVLGYTYNNEDRKGGDMLVLANKTDANHQFYIQNKGIRNSVDAVYETQLKKEANFTIKSVVNMYNRAIHTNLFGMQASQTLWFNEVAYAQKKKQHHFVIGANFNGDNFRVQQPDSTMLQNEVHSTVGLYAQDDWRIHEKLTIQAGLRTDLHNTYHQFILPRVSIMYKPSKPFTIRLNAGLGYKTPTLFNAEIDERDYKNLVGYSKNIQAEKSFGGNLDINYKKKLDDWELTINQTCFFNQIQHPIDEQIVTVNGNPNGILYFNQNKPVQTAGFETYIAAHKDELELYVGYVFTDAQRQYNATNKQLPLIAKHKFASVVAFEFSESCRAGIEAAYTGKQYLDNGTSTPGYLFAAAMFRYSWRKFSFVANVENLFDYRQNKQYPIVSGPSNNPTLAQIWAPIDGRVVNFSVMYKW